ncbi:MAG TPA: hypothetical protein VMR06_08265 [Dokdonella sp.]|uniref:hypothetical protein n=1 Tax=Dokdonella sp. TaxID=2291710 RepID=UPI002BFBF04B|nr:hypothetical protein [Dokdonella sp.]HUD41977.1 hypothetical protein [Dokdonella sp.]
MSRLNLLPGEVASDAIRRLVDQAQGITALIRVSSIGQEPIAEIHVHNACWAIEDALAQIRVGFSALTGEAQS